MDRNFPFGNFGDAGFRAAAPVSGSLKFSCKVLFFSSFSKKNKAESLSRGYRPKKSGGFWSWLAAAAALAALIFIFKNFFVEWEKRRAIDREISALKKEIEQLEKERGGMENFAQYLKTEEFQEKELRDKLNLVKEGEAVVYVKEKDDSEEEKLAEKFLVQPPEEAEVLVKKPNYYYWWKFLFELK